MDNNEILFEVFQPNDAFGFPSGVWLATATRGGRIIYVCERKLESHAMEVCKREVEKEIKV